MSYAPGFDPGFGKTTETSTPFFESLHYASMCVVANLEVYLQSISGLANISHQPPDKMLEYH
jgi:hypothetical protein